MNIIVKEGKVNKQEVKQKLEKWMNTDYLHLLEFFYKPIQKKIFIEEYKDNGVDGLIDYKFWCFNGEPKFYGIGAGQGHGRTNYYNLDGFYKRIILHYATILKYIGLLIPNPGFGKDLSEQYIQKKYYGAMDFLDANNIPFNLEECTHKGDCPGTCPKCERKE